MAWLLVVVLKWKTAFYIVDECCCKLVELVHQGSEIEYLIVDIAYCHNEG